MEVHSVLGSGFQERIYQRSLGIELKKAGLQFQMEVTMPMIYKGINVGTRRVDLVCENKVLVELKAVTQLEGSHMNQTLNYLEVFNYQAGLLINFGANSLQTKRLLNKKFKPRI